jgi:mRNA interferase MazF
LNRGDLVTIAAGGHFTGKPRPAVVIQADAFLLDSITVCLLTGDRVDTVSFRVPVEPDGRNGLEQPSWIMADKIVTLRRRHVGRVFGRLSEADMQRLAQAITIFLGLGSAAPASEA